MFQERIRKNGRIERRFTIDGKRYSLFSGGSAKHTDNEEAFALLLTLLPRESEGETISIKRLSELSGLTFVELFDAFAALKQRGVSVVGDTDGNYWVSNSVDADRFTLSWTSALSRSLERYASCIRRSLMRKHGGGDHVEKEIHRL